MRPESVHAACIHTYIKYLFKQTPAHLTFAVYVAAMTSVSISHKISVRREARQHDMLMNQVNLKRTFQVL